MTTGDLIKARRKEIAMSAERLAEKVGVSPATIYRYEKGDIEKVPVDVIKDIAKALNTTPAYLMGWETSPAAPTIPAGFEPLPEMTTIPLVGSIACGCKPRTPPLPRSSTPTTSSTKSKLKARRSGFAGGYKEFPCTIGQSAGA